MRNRTTTILLMLAAFSGGMWTWRTVHFMTYHGSSTDRSATDRLDPAAIYKVPIGEAPTHGNESRKITIVSFSDFQCPFCASSAETLRSLQRKYGADLLIAFKHRPLPFHENAMSAAIAAEAARRQGKFWEMHDKLFANQKQLDSDSLKSYAREIGLDVARFEKDCQDDGLKARVKADVEEADRFGIRGTPAFFVNGRALPGAVGEDRFVTIIDEELARANAQLATGVSRNELYGALIANGRTSAGKGALPARKGMR
jgi:protein-disulfide isomerase